MTHQTGNLREVFLFVLPYAALEHAVRLSFFLLCPVITPGVLALPLCQSNPWLLTTLCSLPPSHYRSALREGQGKTGIETNNVILPCFPKLSAVPPLGLLKRRPRGCSQDLGSASGVGGVGAVSTPPPWPADWPVTGSQGVSAPNPPSQAPALCRVYEQVWLCPIKRRDFFF